jgi:hypothetical protein
MSGSNIVIANLYKWATMKRAGIEGLSLTTAGNMQNYARQNRPWKDQTGNARAGLNGGYFWENPEILKMYIAHSMSYGPFLELAHDRKYQILEPTVNKFKDSWYGGVKRIMER